MIYISQEITPSRPHTSFASRKWRWCFFDFFYIFRDLLSSLRSISQQIYIQIRHYERSLHLLFWYHDTSLCINIFRKSYLIYHIYFSSLILWLCNAHIDFLTYILLAIYDEFQVSRYVSESAWHSDAQLNHSLLDFRTSYFN